MIFGRHSLTFGLFFLFKIVSATCNTPIWNVADTVATKGDIHIYEICIYKF